MAAPAGGGRCLSQAAVSESLGRSCGLDGRLAQEEARDAVLRADSTDGGDHNGHFRGTHSNSIESPGSPRSPRSPRSPSTFVHSLGSIKNEVVLNLHLDKAFHLEKYFAAKETGLIEGFFCNYVKGFEGQLKLKDYSLRRVILFGGLASMFCKGTVFLMDNTVKLMCLQQIFIVVSVAVLGRHLGLLEEDVHSFDVLTKQTSSLVPLILGLYISVCMARWWALREKSIGSIFSCLTDVCMLMAVQRPEPEWKPLHVQLSKFGLASIQLILKAARNHTGLDDLLTNELLTQDEVEYLVQLELFQRPVAVWSWILRLCSFGFVGLPPPEYNVIQASCTQAKSSIDNIYTYMQTQLPFAYVHLVACLTHVQNVLAAIHAGLMISLDFGGTEVWVRELGMAVVVCLVYQGLLAITYVVEDPFGDDLLDFPIKSYTAYVMASVHAVQVAQWNSPALEKLRAQLQAGDS